MIYLDHAATTPVKKDVLDAMLPYFTESFANASGSYSSARKARSAMDAARTQIAQAIGAKRTEIYFTSGGSESDNWALFGAVRASGKKRIITTAIEHHAILEACAALEHDRIEVAYAPVDSYGRVDLHSLRSLMTEETALVSVMLANNEVGTVQPVAEIAKIAHEFGALMHTDAVQAVGHIPVDIKADNIDLLSLSGHKFHGPKGVGALYCKKGIRLPNLIEGGAQERNRRAGTENVPAIVGMAAALRSACDNMEENTKKLVAMREQLIEGILKIDLSRINGDRERRLPGNVSACFEGVEGESLLLYLDLMGISASSGSACTSGSLDPSHVLLSIGLVHEVAHGSLRLSLCEENTPEEMEYILEKLPPIIDRLRDMSPLWEKIQKERGLI